MNDMNNFLETETKTFLSLCMIVKNEIQNLPRCLNSIKPYVDEMIIIDTGSHDETPEMAVRYGAKVRYFEWCDDFAAARNYAISQASGRERV
ncbi:MAG: glycosyltransferase, partial [Coleofasciculus sp. S288]|nr:glycosyltransferase [Coleofasciculus sp. S288]